MEGRVKARFTSLVLITLLAPLSLGAQVPRGSSLPPAGSFEGTVVKIADGDTPTVLVNRKQIKVRLVEIERA